MARVLDEGGVLADAIAAVCGAISSHARAGGDFDGEAFELSGIRHEQGAQFPLQRTRRNGESPWSNA
jgi:hypothetical protein